MKTRSVQHGNPKPHIQLRKIKLAGKTAYPVGQAAAFNPPPAPGGQAPAFMPGAPGAAAGDMGS